MKAKKRDSRATAPAVLPRGLVIAGTLLAIAAGLAFGVFVADVEQASEQPVTWVVWVTVALDISYPVGSAGIAITHLTQRARGVNYLVAIGVMLTCSQATLYLIPANDAMRLAVGSLCGLALVASCFRRRRLTQGFIIANSCLLLALQLYFLL